MPPFSWPQDEIGTRTATSIATKGRYYAPGAPREDKEKPIYLKITPGVTCGPVSKHGGVGGWFAVASFS